MESSHAGGSEGDLPVLGGRYVVCAGLGRGASSTVYLVFDRQQPRWLAAKVLTVRDDDGSLHQRFVREGRVMAQLSHPNIVTVLEANYQSAPPYLVMELLAGGSIADWVRAHGAMPLALALPAILDLCEALSVVHAIGGIHRDIKPQNLLIGRDGRCRLTDFGIARVDDHPVLIEDDPLTEVGTVMGTMAYMAPEQRLDASSVDRTADIYGVGATLFTILAGRPAADLSLLEAGDRRIQDLPEPVRHIIRRACAFEPKHRYPTIEALKRDLEGVGLPPIPRGTPPLIGRLRDLPPEPPLQLADGDKRALDVLLSLTPEQAGVSSPTLDRHVLDDEPTQPVFEDELEDTATDVVDRHDVPEVQTARVVDHEAATVTPGAPSRRRVSPLVWVAGGVAFCLLFVVLVSFGATLASSHGTLTESLGQAHEARDQLYALLEPRLIDRLEAQGADRAPLAAAQKAFQQEWSEPERMQAAKRFAEAIQSAGAALPDDAPGAGGGLSHSLRRIRAAEGKVEATVEAYERLSGEWPAPWVIGLGLAPAEPL